MALPQLVGHKLVLVSFLLTGVQLLGQNEQGLFLTLQLALAHQKLQQIPHTKGHITDQWHYKLHYCRYSTTDQDQRIKPLYDIYLFQPLLYNLTCSCLYNFLLYLGKEMVKLPRCYWPVPLRWKNTHWSQVFEV